MIKRVMVVLVAFFLLGLVSALPTLDLQKVDIQPGETVLGTINGAFVNPIALKDIQFFEGARQINIEDDLMQFNGTYFFYAYFTRPGNFTIKINNVIYRDSGGLNSVNLIQNLEVKEHLLNSSEQINNSGNMTWLNKTFTKILAVEPGFVISSKPIVKLINVGNSSINVTYLNQTISLNSGESREVSFAPKSNFSYLNFSSYANFAIPIAYIPLNSPVNNSTIINNNLNLIVDPNNLTLKVIAKNRTTATIKLINNGENNITKIVASANISILKIPEVKENISAKSIYELNLTFYSDVQGYFKENLIINYSEGNLTGGLSIPLEVYVFPENSSENITIQPSSNKCSSIAGSLCISGQACNGTLTRTDDGACCIGNCYFLSTDDGGSSYSWIWGIVLFIILGGGGYLVYKKYKKTTPKKPEEEIAKKSKLYEQRVSGGLSRS